jgi:hypothetical protein
MQNFSCLATNSDEVTVGAVYNFKKKPFMNWLHLREKSETFFLDYFK